VTSISATSTSALRTETRRSEQAHRPPVPYRGRGGPVGPLLPRAKGNSRKWHPFLCHERLSSTSDRVRRCADDSSSDGGSAARGGVVRRYQRALAVAAHPELRRRSSRMRLISSRDLLGGRHRLQFGAPGTASARGAGAHRRLRLAGDDRPLGRPGPRAGGRGSQLPVVRSAQLCDRRRSRPDGRRGYRNRGKPIASRRGPRT
jgi:hypothetical protein